MRPDGAITLNSTQGDFSFRLVCDSHPTDWHTLLISGKDAKAVSVTPDTDGWILTADAFDHITLHAENDTDQAFLTFSANAGKVKICEADAETIVVYADTDHDGKYETEIARSGVRIAGDADGDGAVRVNDAVLLSRYIAECDDLTDDQLASIGSTDAADLDGDGLLTIRDYQRLAEMLLSEETQ